MHRCEVVVGNTGDVEVFELLNSRRRFSTGGTHDRINGVNHCLQIVGGGDSLCRQHGQHVVDHRQIVGRDIGDAGIGINTGRGGRAATTSRKSGQRGLRCRSRGGGRGGHALQFCQGVHAAAVVGRGCNGVLYRKQVVVGDARDGQCLQLGQSGRYAPSSGAEHSVNCSHHRLQLGRGVDGCSAQASHSIVDNNQVVRRDTTYTRVGIHTACRGGAARVNDKSGQRRLRRCGLCRSDIGQYLELGERVNTAAVVGRGSNSVLHSSEVVAGDAHDVQALQLVQIRTCTTRSTSEHGIDSIDHRLQLSCGVGSGCAQGG